MERFVYDRFLATLAKPSTRRLAKNILDRDTLHGMLRKGKRSPLDAPDIVRLNEGVPHANFFLRPAQYAQCATLPDLAQEGMLARGKGLVEPRHTGETLLRLPSTDSLPVTYTGSECPGSAGQGATAGGVVGWNRTKSRRVKDAPEEYVGQEQGGEKSHP